MTGWFLLFVKLLRHLALLVNFRPLWSLALGCCGGIFRDTCGFTVGRSLAESEGNASSSGAGKAATPEEIEAEAWFDGELLVACAGLGLGCRTYRPRSSSVVVTATETHLFFNK